MEGVELLDFWIVCVESSTINSVLSVIGSINSGQLRCEGRLLVLLFI